jgi:hypothetical protein
MAYLPLRPLKFLRRFHVQVIAVSPGTPIRTGYPVPFESETLAELALD